jgi:hypothetical protein
MPVHCSFIGKFTVALIAFIFPRDGAAATSPTTSTTAISECVIEITIATTSCSTGITAHNKVHSFHINVISKIMFQFIL